MIKALTEDLRNKISAGEVVENPASVVKELIENSLDANSTELAITIEKGGHQIIQVRDNGIGIPLSDLPSSIMRFHTSKIESLNDLFEIGTLGFRGEALASIASVSEIIIEDLPKDIITDLEDVSLFSIQTALDSSRLNFLIAVISSRLNYIWVFILSLI